MFVPDLAGGALGRSHDYRDRADAGHGLAGFAEMQEALGPLLELVLDPGDTFVTRVTAEAVLRRKDWVGLTIVASALAVADSRHSDWIHTATVDVFSIFSDDRDSALKLCEELPQDTDDRVALGARQMHEILAEIVPVLRPAQHGSKSAVRAQVFDSKGHLIADHVGKPSGASPAALVTRTVLMRPEESQGVATVLVRAVVWSKVGTPTNTGESLRSRRASSWEIFSSAAARLTDSPSTSPSQPSRSASAIRSARLSWISMSRGRSAGETMRTGHRTRASLK
ncbi:hypothetical protein ACIRYZ_23565 [Kitasatospora sp. NPDC101155]|uniref:hypothetical protein n=1 Tax=Kitasatospora sp. NPDC101155 TaxID=3364097 RepID=UPI003818827E